MTNCKKFYLYAGGNDPYVPLDASQKVATALEAPLKIIPNGGHLNAEFGYLKFEELLEDIIKLLYLTHS